MVFEPTGASLESLVGVIRLSVDIEIVRRWPLTTRMWESLFREMEQAALDTDMQLYQQAVVNAGVQDRLGFDAMIRQTDRFVITSISKGSIEITAAVLLAAAWVFKHFVQPGWEKSETKKKVDDAVAGMIDKAGPMLKEQIDVRVVHRLKRLQIRRVSFRRLHDEPLRLSDNHAPDIELVYDKPKQIPKKESPH